MTTTELPAGVQDAMLRLARQLARHNLDIDDLANESGLAFSSVESGDDWFEFYDDDGNRKFSIGFDEDDGRFRVKHHNTTPPPKPESPDTVSVISGVKVVYDGTFADDEAAPSDLAYYEVHASPTPGFTADDTTLVGSIASVDGGTFIHGSTDTFSTYYYAIVAVDSAGNESVKSEEATGVIGGVRGYQDHATAGSDGERVFIHLTYTPIPDTTVHVKWNGGVLQRDEWEFSALDNYVELLSDSWWKAGDVFEAQYLYIDPTPLPFGGCDVWVPLPLVGMTFLHRIASFTPWGRLIDGVICPNPAAITEAGANWADYYSPDFELDPAKYYLFEVTFDPTSPHGDGNRDVYVTSARPGFEVTDFDSSYSSFPGHEPWANLYYSKVWDTFGDVKRFIIGPGIESWDDATFGPAAGFTRPIIESESGAVSNVRVMQVCNEVEAEYIFKLDTGVPDGGAVLVGAADMQTALSDHDDSSYVVLVSGGSGHTANLRVVPQDLTAHTWERMWLEFELEVVGGGSAELNWEIHMISKTSDLASHATWNTPVTVNTGTLIQTIPLSFNVWPFGGDTGDWDAEFSPENVIYQASRNDSSNTYVWLAAYVEGVPAQGDIRIKRLTLKVARPVGV